MVVASFNKSCPCEQSPDGSFLFSATSSWGRAGQDADAPGAPLSTPTPPCHHGQGYLLGRNYLGVTHTHTHTTREGGGGLQVNTVQILAQLTSKLEHADNKAHPGESISPPTDEGGRGSRKGGVDSREREQEREKEREREEVRSGFWQHSTCCFFTARQSLCHLSRVTG